MFILFTSCIILCFVLDVVSCIEIPKEALIFDRYAGVVLLLPNGPPKEGTCGAWATACPVPESARGDLIKHAVLVNEIYDRGSKASEMNINVCKESYKLALVFEFTHMRFLFGYAIYYKLKNEEYFRSSNLRRFATPAKITEIMRKYSARKGNYLRGEGFRIMKAAENDNSVRNEEMWYNRNQKVEFLWVRLFSLSFDFYLKILKKIVYSILPNNKWPGGERCEDYSLGSEVYEETDIDYVDNLYSKENQNQIFQSVKIPKRECVDGVCPMPTPCERTKICLSKWLLIPLDQFIFGSTTSPVCSNMATVPIWTDKVGEALKKVDQYLYALYQVIGETLLVTAGVAEDVLELPLENAGWRSKSTKIFLDQAKEKIPVPKIVYKIVKYRALRDDSQINSVWYSAIVVIHNDPYYKKGARICNEDVTTKWGWEKMTKAANGDDFGNVYVCRYDTKILRKLLGFIIAMKQPPSADLNFFTVSSPKKDKDPLGIKKYVDEEFDRLSRHGADRNFKDEILVRDGGRSQDDGDEEVNDGSNVEEDNKSG